MPTTAHAHCTPYWEKELSLLLKLLVSAFSPTAALPDGRGGARARSTLLAAVILIFFFEMTSHAHDTLIKTQQITKKKKKKLIVTHVLLDRDIVSPKLFLLCFHGVCLHASKYQRQM